jgi:Uma2 family endonuclease
MSEPARKAPACEELAEDDPFRLGWRYRVFRLPDGKTELREEPLTAADLLDPQLGDHVTQNSWHAAAVHELWDILSWRYESRPDVFVSCDLKMIWRIRGLPNPSPDIAVIPGVHDKTKFRRSFDVSREGTRPVLVIELVSDEPEHQSADHEDKVEIYERAGIAEYLIVDPPNPSCRLTGYRLDAAGRYQPIPPDFEGGLLSATTGIRFQVAPGGRTLHLSDAATGERLLSSSEVRRELERLRDRLA